MNNDIITNSKNNATNIDLIVTENGMIAGFVYSSEKVVNLYLLEGASVITCDDTGNLIVFDNQIVGYIWNGEENVNIHLSEHAYFISLSEDEINELFDDSMGEVAPFMEA